MEPGHGPVARLAARRRQPPAARPPARPDLPPPGDPCRVRPAGAARLARAVPRAQRRRDARPRAARPHAAAPARAPGVHAADRRGDARPDRGDRRRPHRRLRRGGRGRPHRRLRRAAAGHGHRRAARRAGCRPAPATAVVGGLLPDVRDRPERGVGAQGGRRERRVRGVPAGPPRRAPPATRRRPDQRAGRGRRRRRHADRDRADRDLRPAPQRRARGVGQRRGQRLVDALPPSGRARPAARRPGAHGDRDRGAAALRHAVDAVRALGPRAGRGGRRDASARRRGRPAVRVGEPRRGRLRSARRARPRPRPEPVPVVRGRHPLLPRRAARASSSSGSRSRRCSGACRGSSSSSRRAGSRPSSCAGSRRCASGSDDVRYVALGDSYTIGTSVPPADRWPDQLVARPRTGRADPRARRQPGGQRLHLGRPDPGRAAGPRRPRSGLRDRC